MVRSCCRRLSWSSDSAKGLIQRDSTSDSPARPSSRFRFSAVTRSTRSERVQVGPLRFRRRRHRRARRRRVEDGCRRSASVSSDDPRERGQLRVDFRTSRVLPLADGGLVGAGDAGQQIGGREQHVDVRAPQRHAPLLRGHETVFHRVSHAHAGVEPDDPRRALERVRRAHAGVELIGLRRVALQREQAGGEDQRLGVGFHAEELQQREVAEILVDHARLRCNA